MRRPFHRQCRTGGPSGQLIGRMGLRLLWGRSRGGNRPAVAPRYRGGGGRKEHGYTCVMVQARNRTATARRRPATPRQAGARRGALDALLAPELFKALCDPVRARLLACVAKCGRSCSVGEVAQCCELDLSTVSRHLTTLARAGVMESSKRGTSVLYAVRYDYIATTLHALAAAFETCRPSDNCDSKEGGCNGCC